METPPVLYYGIHIIIYYNQHMHHLLRYSFCQGTEPGGELKKSLKPSLIFSIIFCRYYLFLTVLKANNLYLFRYHLSMLQEQHLHSYLLHQHNQVDSTLSHPLEVTIHVTLGSCAKQPQLWLCQCSPMVWHLWGVQKRAILLLKSQKYSHSLFLNVRVCN